MGVAPKTQHSPKERKKTIWDLEKATPQHIRQNQKQAQEHLTALMNVSWFHASYIWAGYIFSGQQGAILCIAGCWALSLASTHYRTVAPFPHPLVTIKNDPRHCQMSPGWVGAKDPLVGDHCYCPQKWKDLPSHSWSWSVLFCLRHWILGQRRSEANPYFTDKDTDMSEGGVSSSPSHLIIHSVSTCYDPDRGSRGWHAEVHPGEQRARGDGYNPFLSAQEDPAHPAHSGLWERGPWGGFMVPIIPRLGEDFLGQKGQR